VSSTTSNKPSKLRPVIPSLPSSFIISFKAVAALASKPRPVVTAGIIDSAGSTSNAPLRAWSESKVLSIKNAGSGSKYRSTAKNLAPLPTSPKNMSARISATESCDLGVSESVRTTGKILPNPNSV